MREILFRGKAFDGKWVEGFYYFLHSYLPTTDTIYRTDHYITAHSVGSSVRPETIGQFTGLTDKNGKKIFEGDIVQYYGTYALEVFIENGHTKTRWFDTVTKSECTELFFGHDEEALGEVEVIGNIHDNPELLEGE